MRIITCSEERREMLNEEWNSIVEVHVGQEILVEVIREISDEDS